MSCQEDRLLTRRRVLQVAAGSAALSFWPYVPAVAKSAGRDPRLLVVVLRGGLDGLSVAVPVGDPDYRRLRRELALPKSGEGAGFALDGTFALHPSMAFLRKLYEQKQATVLHAVASPYRGRSHFDGQDVLESGLGGVGAVKDGWLNRALTKLPDAGRVTPQKGLSIGAVTPLIMRGPADVVTWTPPAYRHIDIDPATVERLQDLYAQTDPELGQALADGVELDRVAGPGSGAAMASGDQMMSEPSMMGMQDAAARPAPKKRGGRRYASFIDTAARAAKFLSSADGPRVGVLSYSGWDTHFNEGVLNGQLANKLGGLDAAIKALHDGLGPAWEQSVILFVTEFGRTAETNGTRGTDHGTATMALMTGGAVRGGRVIADWPGLSERSLYEGR
ncbi:MAG: DUF1501 domain-containing protein, partial [Pseudomonadota bacterium]